MNFKDLGLSEALLKAIDKKGYTQPSPIQEKAIPEVLKGKDVLASAQTGTGKTAGFTLPMLQLLGKKGEHQGKRKIRALVLTPTRELAAQVQENIREYSEFMHIRSTVIFGGVNQNPQVRTIQQGIDILVATPGRLLDLCTQGHINLRDVEFFVLDEADRMLDMGFLRDIERVMKLLPARRQNLMFSATFSGEIKRLAHGILNDPVQVEATPENSTVDLVSQKVYRVDQKRKIEFTIKLISEGDWDQVLIFTRTKHRANRLSEQLTKNSITSAAIHGNKTQGARTKALKGFKDGTIRVLVATDIAARGLDIPLLPHVVNFELPNVPEDYVHRIGRTGRAGASGEAISLVDITELPYLKSIERLIQLSIKKSVVEGYEPKDDTPPDASKPGGRGNQGRNPRGGGGNRSQGSGSGKSNSDFRKKQKQGSGGGGNRNSSGSGANLSGGGKKKMF